MNESPGAAPSVVTYAQAAEDLAVIQAFGGQRNGIFVEAGGFDGVTYSNTCLLEREFGWTGMLVEPIPALAQQCREARPGSTLVEAALASKSGQLRLAVPVDAPEFSSTRGADHLRLRVEAAEVEILDVPAERLDVLLRMAGIRRVDFLSLDVEDAELDSLRGIDLSEFGVRCVLLERDHLDPRIVRLLVSSGLSYLGRHGRNDLWFRKEEGLVSRLVGLIPLLSSASAPTARYLVRRAMKTLGLLETIRKLRTGRSMRRR